jgi:hypothetical protein
MRGVSVIGLLWESPDIYILVYTILLRRFRIHKPCLFLLLRKFPDNSQKIINSRFSSLDMDDQPGTS